MVDQLDILIIDNKIRATISDECQNLPIYKERLKEMEKSLELQNFRRRIRGKLEKSYQELSNYIQSLENESRLNFYLADTTPLLEEYKKILKIPIKMSFLGKPVKKNKIKKRLIKQYIEAASRYMDIELHSTDKTQTIICSNCTNKKEFDVINRNIYTCTKCYAQQTIMRHNSSYSDIDRVNISSKYMYDRKVHFRDCVKQYQGKQNCTIPPKVYKDLEEQFKRHHILIGNEDDPKTIRFRNLTKNHILLFLKDLGYSNHYENVHLIHYTFTGIKPDDISHLEDQLLDDFDALTDLYDKRYRHINRKNFINTQYVLYQLLRRHKHPCKKEEFIILKTIDRKFFHDEVCKTLFEEKGWNHTPFY